MRYYIIAGEASGDLHGSNLMRGLYAEDPQADIRFWGGGLMDEVYHGHQDGTGLVKDYKDGAVIGFTQILIHARAFAKRFTDCTSDILAWKPDVVILIDYPGFNFRVAEFAHKAGFKVFYYIAPKVWASRESRVKKLKAYVDKLFIVFPFEIPYFTKKGVGFVYKGNPLIDAIDNSAVFRETREEFLAKTGLPDRPMIALLAGSRNGEISSMMPTFMEFADRLHAIPEYSDYRFVVAAAPARSETDYARVRWGQGICQRRLRPELRRDASRQGRCREFRHGLAGVRPDRDPAGRGLQGGGDQLLDCQVHHQDTLHQPRQSDP